MEVTSARKDMLEQEHRLEEPDSTNLYRLAEDDARPLIKTLFALRPILRAEEDARPLPSTD